MNYETHSFTQGSPEWNTHRRNCYNASDLSAASGKSPYKTRGSLIHQIATGEEETIDPKTQKRFNDGHRFEYLARPMAEKEIGEDLFPSVLSVHVPGLSRRLSASLDGATMADTINWEHKTLNESLAASLNQGIIPEIYHDQMEQGMMINEAGKCLFSASKWKEAPGAEEEGGCVYGWAENDEGIQTRYVLIDIKHAWYEPNMALRAKIIPTWKQLEEDVAKYQPVEVIPAAVATPTLDLPAVSIRTSGAIAIISNLTKFGDALRGFIAALPKSPSTDQEFADCKAALGKLKKAEEALDSEEAAALAQMSEIDEMRREKKLYQDLARETRLALEKLVDAREKAIKAEIVKSGVDRMAEHIAALNKRLASVSMPAIPADFVGAIKGKRTIASLRDAVDTMLANAKLKANEIADAIQINLATLDENKEFSFLFNDRQMLVMKANDDLVNIIKLRISEHQAEQQRRLDAEREKIRKQEQERADREAAERARKESVAKQETARALQDAAKPAAEVPPPAPAEVKSAGVVLAAPNPNDRLELAEEIIGLLASMDVDQLRVVLGICQEVVGEVANAA